MTSSPAVLAEAGGAGLITPDLIPDEAAEWFEASDKYGLDRVFLVAPSSTPERLDMTVKASRGFVYGVSIMGVTGARQSVSSSAEDVVARAHAAGAERVCVGLGVSNPDHVREIAAYADGVIVGTAWWRHCAMAAWTPSGNSPRTSAPAWAAQLQTPRKKEQRRTCTTSSTQRPWSR